MTAVEGKNALVVGYGLLRFAPLLHAHRFKEKCLHASLPGSLMAGGRTDFGQLAMSLRVKVEHELARDRLHHGPAQAKGEPFSVADRTCLKQGIRYP